MTPTSVSEQFVLSKCDYFVDLHIWPLHSKINPRSWLDNFSASEKEYAIHLLNAFMYYPSDFVNRLFVAGLQALSSIIVDFHETSFLKLQTQWRSFFDRMLITGVTGENPSITDSGNVFARKAKTLFGINEERILFNHEILEEIVRLPRPVVFVDDFVGSGNQFIETWQRMHTLTNGTQTSFENIAGFGGISFYYIPLVCTEYGLNRIQRDCPEAIVLPVHTVSEKYSVFSPTSLVWPTHLSAGSINFIEEISQRAGMDTTDPNSWKGFHELGLTIAFEDSIPDCTLPILSWDQNGWNPLIRRFGNA